MTFTPYNAATGRRKSGCWFVDHGYSAFRLTLGHDVLERLGWQCGDHVARLVGEGEHANMVKVVEAKPGPNACKLFSLGRQSKSLSISMPKAMLGRYERPRVEAFECGKGELTVTLEELQE